MYLRLLLAAESASYDHHLSQDKCELAFLNVSLFIIKGIFLLSSPHIECLCLTNQA